MSLYYSIISSFHIRYLSVIIFVAELRMHSFIIQQFPAWLKPFEFQCRIASPGNMRDEIRLNLKKCVVMVSSLLQRMTIKRGKFM